MNRNNVARVVFLLIGVVVMFILSSYRTVLEVPFWTGFIIIMMGWITMVQVLNKYFPFKRGGRSAPPNNFDRPAI